MLGVPKHGVILVKHNNDWENEFEKTKQILLDIHKDNVVDIQHVGSTSIKGIMAKPMLDIAILLKNLIDFSFSSMASNGYEYFDEVASGHHLFVLRGDGGISLQHIHCYSEKNSVEFLSQVKFRDFIRSNAEYAKEYELLKLKLYKLYPNDRNKYTEGKQEFFDKIKLLTDKN